MSDNSEGSEEDIETSLLAHVAASAIPKAKCGYLGGGVCNGRVCMKRGIYVCDELGSGVVVCVSVAAARSVERVKRMRVNA